MRTLPKTVKTTATLHQSCFMNNSQIFTVLISQLIMQPDRDERVMYGLSIECKLFIAVFQRL